MHGYPRLGLKIRRALALKMCVLVFPVRAEQLLLSNCHHKPFSVAHE